MFTVPDTLYGIVRDDDLEANRRGGGAGGTSEEQWSESQKNIASSEEN